MNGHRKIRIIDAIRAYRDAIIGTSLLPEKNAKKSGSFVEWNLS